MKLRDLINEAMSDAQRDYLYKMLGFDPTEKSKDVRKLTSKQLKDLAPLKRRLNPFEKRGVTDAIDIFSRSKNDSNARSLIKKEIKSIESAMGRTGKSEDHLKDRIKGMRLFIQTVL